MNVNISGSKTRNLKKMMLLSATPKAQVLSSVVPNDGTSVGKYAFSGCTSLGSVKIGGSVSKIDGGSFSGCSSLESFEIENNDNYTATENGLLLANDGKTLVAAVAGLTNVTLPDGVTNILEGAFSDYVTLISVTLPEGMGAIGEAAFSNATAFATITIPSSVTAIGSNAFCDTALATVYVAKGDTARVQALVAGTGYTATVAYVELQDDEPKPSIAGDGEATVTGDAESGYVVTPSTTTDTVDVEIPAGLNADKVTVEVPPTASVKPNGANVAVVKTVDATSYDITEFLDIPAADANGVVNLGDATVKDAIIEEVLDPEKGAELELTPDDPSIKTAETRAGLTYIFYEGTTLEGMTPKAVKTGDGEAWTPPITVKGGSSGFSSVEVTK